MEVAAILPARDEEGAVGEVVRRLRAVLPRVRAIVVDNGSADATAQVARAAGAEVVGCARAGYGHAARAGADAAGSAEVLVFLDADGSMAPEDVPLLLAPILAGEADIVLGRRRTGRGLMPWHQRIGNRVIAALLRRHGIDAAELGPFRAVRGTTLAGLSLPGSRCAWPAAMLRLAASRGARIIEVEVGYGPRLAGRSKVGGSLRGSVLATWEIGRSLLDGDPG